MRTHNNIFSLTNIIIAITIIAYLVQTNINNGALYFGLNIYFFELELYYQIISTIFAHGSYEHLIMNMIVLWQFGNLIESYFSKLKLIILYFVGGILTSIGTLIYMYNTNDWGNVVGASGAISVLFGYIALKDKSQRSGVIIVILLISFVPLLFGFKVAWYSHIIGFVIGWLMGYFI